MSAYEGKAPSAHHVNSASASMGGHWFCKECDRCWRISVSDKKCPKCHLNKGDVFGGHIDGWKNKWSGNPGQRNNETEWGSAQRFGYGEGKGETSKPNGKGKPKGKGKGGKNYHNDKRSSEYEELQARFAELEKRLATGEPPKTDGTGAPAPVTPPLPVAKRKAILLTKLEGAKKVTGMGDPDGAEQVRNLEDELRELEDEILDGQPTMEKVQKATKYAKEANAWLETTISNKATLDKELDDVQNKVNRAATEIEEARTALKGALATQQKFSDELNGNKAAPEGVSGFDATKVTVSPEKLESLNITKEQFDKVAAAIQEASHSTPAEVVKEDAGDSDDDKDGDNDQTMAPADTDPDKEEPPPKAKETHVATIPATGQIEQAQGSKRREEENTFQEFAASLGEEAGEKNTC